MKHLLSRYIPVLAALAFAGPALAQQTVVVTANVAKSCAIDASSSNDITINYDPLVDSAGPSASNAMAVVCTKGTKLYIHANAGTTGTVGTFARGVTDGTNKIGYDLQFNGSTLDPTAGVNVLVGTASAKTIPLPVVLTAILDSAATDPVSGTYSDSVLVDLIPM